MVLATQNKGRVTPFSMKFVRLKSTVPFYISRKRILLFFLGSPTVSVHCDTFTTSNGGKIKTSQSAAQSCLSLVCSILRPVDKACPRGSGLRRIPWGVVKCFAKAKAARGCHFLYVQKYAKHTSRNGHLAHAATKTNWYVNKVSGL